MIEHRSWVVLVCDECGHVLEGPANGFETVRAARTAASRLGWYVTASALCCPACGLDIGCRDGHRVGRWIWAGPGLLQTHCRDCGAPIVRNQSDQTGDAP